MVEREKSVLNCIKGINDDSYLFLFGGAPCFFIGQLRLQKLKKRNIKIILHISDINSFQKFRRINVYKYIDKSFYRLADKIIVPTDKMKEFIIRNFHICSEKIIVQYIYDYQITENASANIDVRHEGVRNEIVIAGNLSREKTRYIYSDLVNIDNIVWNLYGPNYESNNTISSNVNYKGNFDCDTLPGKLEGTWGLVWNSDSAEKLSGVAGEYQKINGPHKCSLYIASKIPIIISDEAAMAEFVKNKEIGITVHSIYDISEKINSITSDEYMRIKENVIHEAEKLRGGFYLKQALKKI